MATQPEYICIGFRKAPALEGKWKPFSSRAGPVGEIEKRVGGWWCSLLKATTRIARTHTGSRVSRGWITLANASVLASHSLLENINSEKISSFDATLHYSLMRCYLLSVLSLCEMSKTLLSDIRIAPIHSSASRWRPCVNGSVRSICKGLSFPPCFSVQKHKGALATLKAFSLSIGRGVRRALFTIL